MAAPLQLQTRCQGFRYTVTIHELKNDETVVWLHASKGASTTNFTVMEMTDSYFIHETISKSI
jgi:hypothetical protein